MLPNSTKMPIVFCVPDCALHKEYEVFFNLTSFKVSLTELKKEQTNKNI
jgi:hypothetical protein